MDVDRTAAPEQGAVVYITHKTKITAVHRLWSNTLSEHNNSQRYGSAINVHGHEYTFKVTFRGVVRKNSGTVTGPTELLEEVVALSIGEILDRKNLDVDISYFFNRTSSLENVCLFVWRNLDVIMRPHPFDVAEVKVKVSGCRQAAGGHGLVSSEVTYRGETTDLAP